MYEVELQIMVTDLSFEVYLALLTQLLYYTVELRGQHTMEYYSLHCCYNCQIWSTTGGGLIIFGRGRFYEGWVYLWGFVTVHEIQN